jgi:hypothetical protein
MIEGAPEGEQHAFRAISHPFRVESEIPGLLALVSHLLRDLHGGWDPAAHRYELRKEAQRPPFAAYVDGSLIRRVGSTLALVDELLWHVNRSAILTPDPKIAIHASAAVWEGRGILFPAPANSGKTTLAAALLMRGAVYVTDEAGLIDPRTSLLHSYPKPIWMSPSAVRAVAGLRDRLRPEYRSLDRVRAYATPKDLGTVTASDPVRVHLVVSPSYREGTATKLESISRAEAMMELATNAFALSRFGKQGIVALTRVVEGARCYRLTFGDLGSALSLLVEAFEESNVAGRSGITKGRVRHARHGTRLTARTGR